MDSFKINFIILLVGILSCSCFKQQKSDENSIFSIYTKNIVIPSWSSEEWNSEECEMISGDTVGSENQLFMISRWNKDSLYFFFKVLDSDLRAYQTLQDHPQLFLDDMVEILLDTANDKDSCWNENDIIYHVNLLGIKKDDRGTAGCVSDPTWNGVAGITVKLFGTLNDTTDIDKGFLINLAFPWTELELVPKKGLVMGINFANGDNDGKGRQLYDWMNASPFRSPYAFGNLVLR